MFESRKKKKGGLSRSHRNTETRIVPPIKISTLSTRRAKFEYHCCFYEWECRTFSIYGFAQWTHSYVTLVLESFHCDDGIVHYLRCIIRSVLQNAQLKIVKHYSNIDPQHPKSAL